MAHTSPVLGRFLVHIITHVGTEAPDYIQPIPENIGWDAAGDLISSNLNPGGCAVYGAAADAGRFNPPQAKVIFFSLERAFKIASVTSFRLLMKFWISFGY